MRDLRNAQSYENGIAFYSSILSDVFVYMSYDKDKKIQNKIYTNQGREFQNTAERFKKHKSTIKNISLIIGILIMSLAAITNRTEIILSSFVFVMFVLENLVYMLFDAKTFRFKDKETMYSLVKFHGAEHMAVNAYYRLKRIPTLEEVKKESMFSIRCGSLIRIRKVVYYSLTCLVILLLRFDLKTYLYGAAVLGIFSIIETNTNFLKVFEILFVSKPTDDELVLAIEGLKEFEKMEESFEKKEKLFGRINFRFDEETGEFLYFSDHDYEAHETW